MRRDSLCYFLFGLRAASLLALLLLTHAAGAIDLLGGIFAKPVINKQIWEMQEQFVALTPQGLKADERYPPNAHPATLEPEDIRDAFKSLELWDKGGFFRNEESHPLLSTGQADMLGRVLAEALLKAKPDEDVIFNLRGYSDVMLDTAKEREWTAGRAFYAEGKLNLIIGTYRLRKDRGQRNAEAAHGVVDNYNDLFFDTGSRAKQTGKMPGRVVATAGVDYYGGADGKRPDWVVIDLNLAALGYREEQIPEEQRKTAEKAKQEAAKLTLERRQMREEMARLRQQIKDLSAGGGSVKTVEERLATLDALRARKLVTEEEYARRRNEILNDL
jgi:hypothetical protein